MTTAEITIRPAHSGDAARVAELSAQLGYPLATAEAEERLAALARDPRSAVLVAEAHDAVVGWIALHEKSVLHSPRHCEISGLVVDEKARGGGVGTRLVQAAEGWARARGLALLRVRSNSTRMRTHAYYVKLGFTAGKISHNFEKPLTEI